MIGAALALFFATPAASAAPLLLPSETSIVQAAHNRFPNANSEFVAKLAIINYFFNQAIVGVDDDEHYGVTDKWVSNPSDWQGDCEDYATSKLVWLEDQQPEFEAVSHARLRFVTVKVLGQAQPAWHVVVEVRLNDGSIAVLDNLFDELMTRKELERTYGYTFFDW